MIELDGVGHVHAARSPWERRALTGIDLRIEPGERLLVVGANGSGKSTLAWILAGLLVPTEGSADRVLPSGDRVGLDDLRTEIGLVVQHARLQLLRPSVGEELGAFADDVSAQEAALRSMGFGFRDRARRVDDLSIGQQRRVAIAAQLARSASMLVLDEPMAGLDRAGRTALVSAITALPVDTTVITVTHDLLESEALGSRVITLEAGRLTSDRVAS